MFLLKNIYFNIAMGGAVGAIFRYLVSNWICQKNQQLFPLGTFAVNIIGCFLIGIIYTLTIEKSAVTVQVRALLSVGFLGAFTTFSTYSLESLVLIKDGNILAALFYLGGSIFCGVLGVWLGMTVAS